MYVHRQRERKKQKSPRTDKVVLRTFIDQKQIMFGLVCLFFLFFFLFTSPYYMKWSLSGCNFYFLVQSAPVAFGLNVYDRWTGLCLHHLVYNPSVCIYAMLGSGTGPMGIFISADFLSASIVLLQCPLSLMDLALYWAHLQNIVPDSCQIICCRLQSPSPSTPPPPPRFLFLSTSAHLPT